MFTVEDREFLRDRLISAGRADARVSGAALTGSAALGREDRWSDIDLALCVSADADRAAVIADWTDRMYGEHAAVHHVDIADGETLYRVFLLGRHAAGRPVLLAGGGVRGTCTRAPASRATGRGRPST